MNRLLPFGIVGAADRSYCISVSHRLNKPARLTLSVFVAWGTWPKLHSIAIPPGYKRRRLWARDRLHQKCIRDAMISSHVPVAPDLIGWRTKGEISLSTIAEATKISRRYLEAIESGKFQCLPGGAYSLSYLRQYAEAIDFEADDLIKYFHSVMASSDASKPLTESPSPLIRRFWDHIRSLGAIVSPGEIPQPRD